MSAGHPPLLMLDTAIVIHLVRGKGTGLALDREFDLRARSDRPLICVVTVGECLSFGAQRGWGKAKMSQLEALLRELVVVDIRSRNVLARYAEMDRYLVKNGKSLGDNDVWIAAAASAANATLVTTDKDFDPLHPEYLNRIWFDPDVREGAS